MTTRNLFTGLCAILLLAGYTSAQEAAKPTIKAGYAIHNSVDLGGHYASQWGSGAMYDTMVNIQSGPRILNQSLELHAVRGEKHFPLFDTLYTSATGFGGDPNNYAVLRASKGKLYDFSGTFRRDRQFFDYNLLGNPLIPAGLTQNGYTFPQMMDSAHYYNTVRRMTDVNLTLFPVGKYTVRLAYSKVLMQGPSASSVHDSGNAMLLQNFRNSNDSYTAALDWKPLHRTVLTLQEDVTLYKGNTNWQIANYNMLPLPGNLLGNSALPSQATIGYDNVGFAINTITSTTTNATAGPYPTTAGSTSPIYIGGGSIQLNPLYAATGVYTRSQPMRTLVPTTSFRFVTTDIPKLHLTGDIRYTSSSMQMPAYNEYFAGLKSGVLTQNLTGSGYAQRVDAAGSLGAVYNLTDRIALTDNASFNTWRIPSIMGLYEQDQSANVYETVGTTKYYSMITAPSATLPAAAITQGAASLNQRTFTNLASVAYNLSPRASFSLGYRYKQRMLNKYLATGTVLSTATPTDNYTLYFHENGGVLTADLTPINNLKINGQVEVSYADAVYVQTAPRALQHYKLRANYKPVKGVTVYGTFNDLERRDNVSLVNNLNHNRSITLGGSIQPNEHYGVDFNYGYTDVFSQSTICFVYTATQNFTLPSTVYTLPGSTVAGSPLPGSSAGSNPCQTVTIGGVATSFLSNTYSDTPTQTGAVSVMLAPNAKVRGNLGYRVTNNNGTVEMLHPLDVPGAQQTQYLSPFASVALTLKPDWVCKADYNYYGYGEQGAPAGPTASRTFHANVVTLGIHYEF